MANEHPFHPLFESLGHLPLAHAEAVNRQAYEVLYDILSVPVEKTGRCILLRAPRAGHGKTHLLSRIEHHLGASHEFIPLHAAFGNQIDAGTVIDDALRRLLRLLPASGGLCVLDLVARRLFALALQPLVEGGEVPCQDPKGTLAALQTRPVEIFDFQQPNAVTAIWARDNFAALSQRFSVELAQRCGLPILEVAFWVDALFRFATTPVGNPLRLRVLVDLIHEGNPGNRVIMERLEALLGMLALLMRVVLVADNLEGFASDEKAALRLSAFLGTLRQSVERLDVILSLNQDIWQSAFAPCLSDGLADRLSEVVIELKPLTEEEMLALLESRVPGLGSRILARVNRAAAGTYARGLIRAAGVAWLRASAMDSSLAGATTAPEQPAPLDVTGGQPSAPPSPVESPFEIVVENETHALAAELPSAAPEQPAPLDVIGVQPAAAPPSTVESPFEIVVENEAPALAPAPPSATPLPALAAAAAGPPSEPTETPVVSAPPGDGPDPDRVDSLLKQFLQRYGQDRR